MTSEKWFDWDTSDSPGAEASAPAVSPEVSSDAGTPLPEGGGVVPPAALDEFQPLEAMPVEPMAGEPAESPAPALSDALSDPPADARFDQQEQRTATALKQLNVPAPPAVVDAARPFHLWITGALRNHEKERLVELIARENFGIREVDLEIQFEAGRILLPRISEFCVVLVAQTLRGAAVELKLEPSEHATAPHSPDGFQARLNPASAQSKSAPHPAEDLPVTDQPLFAGRGEHEALDVLMATGMIQEPEWRAETSDAFSEMVESLKRELRFKAHLKGADGLVNYEAKVMNSPWITESECRIQVTATAVRFRK
jgi:hypothetical protein